VPGGKWGHLLFAGRASLETGARVALAAYEVGRLNLHCVAGLVGRDREQLQAGQPVLSLHSVTKL
jgi:hypothetical protein